MKQRIVVKIQSIQVQKNNEAEEGRFPTSKKSLFSDNYDLNRESKRLKKFIKNNQQLTEEHPEYKALNDWKYHRALLKKHIYQNHTSSRFRRTKHPEDVNLDDYNIFTSEDESFKSLGSLADINTDSICLHTKQAVRLWFGNNDKSQPHKRWPGIRYAMGLTGQLIKLARNDQPFALDELIKFEKNITELVQYITKEKEKAKFELDKLSERGINIHLAATPNPTEIPVENIRGYGFILIQFLNEYDTYVRYMMTMSKKGIISNRKGSEKIREVSSRYRSMAQQLFVNTMNIRSIDKVTRAQFLDNDEETASRLIIAIKQGFFDLLSRDTLTFKTKPQFAHIESKYNDEELQKICKFAEEHGLIEQLPSNVQKNSAV